ncbi:riboflavin synthase [Hyphobacterium sp. CCMP332]|nr:riboflavin synthase [Hyphobacterium sp. CCMP332]
MFTGIIENLGEIKTIRKEGTNIHFGIDAPFKNELKVDQSVAHDGVCLTVTEVDESLYNVTAIEETLDRTALKIWEKGRIINLERCMPANGRFDGHIVQGHVDQIGIVEKIENHEGSWKYLISYDDKSGNITVEKGSICVNGVSLTVVDSEKGLFSVAIIPFTFEHTNFKHFEKGTPVNLEFDILGKYIQKVMAQHA